MTTTPRAPYQGCVSAIARVVRGCLPPEATDETAREMADRLSGCTQGPLCATAYIDGYLYAAIETVTLPMRRPALLIALQRGTLIEEQSVGVWWGGTEGPLTTETLCRTLSAHDARHARMIDGRPCVEAPTRHRIMEVWCELVAVPPDGTISRWVGSDVHLFTRTETGWQVRLVHDPQWAPYRGDLGVCLDTASLLAGIMLREDEDDEEHDEPAQEPPCTP